MKVAVVAEWYPSPGDPVHGLWAHRQAVAAAAGGVETTVLALRRPVPPLRVARKLAQLPPDFGALGAWGRDARQSLRPTVLDGIPIESVPWIGPPRPISYGSWGYWMAPALGRALDRLYERWEFDLLHAHCLAPAGHAAARWLRRRGAGTVGGGGGGGGSGSSSSGGRGGAGTARSRRSERSGRPAFAVSAHGPDMFDVPNRGAVGRHACVTALDTADLVIANSDWARDRCDELAGRPLPARVVHLGADVLDRSQSEIAARRDDDRQELRLVTIAHLQARKRHDTVLQALALLEPEVRPSYVVIGDGEERGRLERIAAGLGLSARVRFAGQLPNRQALSELAACDVFVMPGIHEPFGVAFVEAMAAGMPAIGGRGEGGPMDIAAAGEGMLLVTPGDAAELADVLRGLDRDRDRLRRLGLAARATVAANFTWEACGERTVAAYGEALRNRDAGVAAPLASAR